MLLPLTEHLSLHIVIVCLVIYFSNEMQICEGIMFYICISLSSPYIVVWYMTSISSSHLTTSFTSVTSASVYLKLSHLNLPAIVLSWIVDLHNWSMHWKCLLGCITDSSKSTNPKWSSFFFLKFRLTTSPKLLSVNTTRAKWLNNWAVKICYLY